MEEMEQVIRIFPQKLRRLLKQAETERFQAEELRLRAGGPFLMAAGGKTGFFYRTAANGCLRRDGEGRRFAGQLI